MRTDVAVTRVPGVEMANENETEFEPLRQQQQPKTVDRLDIIIVIIIINIINNNNKAMCILYSTPAPLA